jgi:hypothetical protein
VSSFAFLTDISFYGSQIFFLMYEGNRPIIGTYLTRHTLRENFLSDKYKKKLLPLFIDVGPNDVCKKQ